MQKFLEPRHGLALAFVATLAICASAAASADPLSPAKQTCTTLNCGTLALPGRINAHPASPAIANVWVGQFAGAAQSCLRFQVSAESRDLTMSVVAPNGTVFTNDNGGVAGCTACPRVVVGTATNGFYTVTVANKGAAAVESSFTLRAGLYNKNNSPNCASPTVGK